VAVLPVVILIIEGASFQNLKIARAENGIVNDGSVLETRRLRKALILRARLLLIARRVAPGLVELLAGLVLLGSYMGRRPSAWATTARLVQWWKGTLETILLGKGLKGAVGWGSSAVEELCIELCIVPEACRTLSPV